MVCFSEISQAQLSVKGIPYSFELEEKSAQVLPLLALDAIDIDEQLKYDDKNKIENRFAVGETVNISIPDEAVKTELAQGTIYQYQIVAEGAKSLGLYFDDFHLPDGAELFIYNQSKTQLLGAFTAENNKQTRQLAIAQLVDDNLIIDYYEPDNADFKGTLLLGKVYKSYREIASVLSTTAARVGINCPAGDDWQEEKHAVCRMFFYEDGSGYYCSGALVNNTRFDGTPYFLTANHCISDSAVARSLVTYFNYENSTCTNRDASLTQSLSGSTFKTNYVNSDVSLLELSEFPPKSYQPYFAGWNIYGTPAKSGAGIHHPGGSPKCISLTNNIYSADYQINWDDSVVTPPNSHWAVEFYNGTTEQGSSGSPLFNSDGQIVGQLHGGNDEISFYGKLYYAWKSGGLSKFLDPEDSGSYILEGTYIATDFEVETPFACTGANVQLVDRSIPKSQNWTWKIEPSTFEYVEETNANSENPIVQFLNEGSYSITLTIENDFGKSAVTYDNIISVSDELDVHFTNVADRIEICGVDFDSYEFEVTGAADYDFYLDKEKRFDAITTNNILTLALRDEYKTEPFSFSIIVNGMHGTCSNADTVFVDVLIPENDYVENAAILNLGTNSGYTNTCAGIEALEPKPKSGNCLADGYWCSDTDGLLQNSVWFKFLGPSSGVVSIEADGFDTQIALYKAESESDILSNDKDLYEIIAANDNPVSAVKEALIEDVPVEPGKIYWLQVDGNQGSTGDLTINLLSNSLELLPNPANQEVAITFASKVDADVIFELYSLTGDEYTTAELQTQLDDNTYLLDVSALPGGIYVLHAVIGDEIFTRRLSIVH